MNRHGFALTELLVVIILMSILLAIATHNYSAWQRKSLVERYTKEFYTDLQDARLRGTFTKQRQTITLGPQQYVFRRYSNEFDLTGTILSTKNIPVPFTTNPGWTPAGVVSFDTRGVMSDPVPTAKVICMTTNEEASYDALIITGTLTSMGKVTDRGLGCAQNNVTQK